MTDTSTEDLMVRSRAVPAAVVWLFVAVHTAALPGGPSQTQSAATDTLALTHARVIDGTGAAPLADQTLIIEGGRIRALGATSAVAIPAGTRTRDLSGRTIMPGLVMLHEHMEWGAGTTTHAQPFSAPRLFLAYGVTTIRTAGTDHPYVDLNLKRQIDEGTAIGPEVFVTSPYLNGPGNVFLGDNIVRNAEDARRAVRYWAAEGVSSFKVYQHISKEALSAIIDEAHRAGLPVTAHLRSVTCREAVELGIDNLEHGFGPCTRRTADNLGDDSNGPRARAFIRLLIDRKVVLTFTPIEIARPLSDEELQLLNPTARDEYLSKRAGARAANVPATTLNPSLTTLQGQLTLAFARAGGQLVLGSDPGCCDVARMAGVSNHDAVKLAVKTGFTPLEVIRMATVSGATFLKIQQRTGTIAVGKEADLLVVRGDPAVTIDDIDNVEITFANGVAFDPEKLLAEVKGQVGWR
jgi:imidazolonepropionase-like amidohydrolase